MNKLSKLIYPIKFPTIGLGVDIKATNKTAILLHKNYFKYRKRYFKNIKNSSLSFYNWIVKEITNKSPKLISKNSQAVKELTGMSVREQYLDLIWTCLTMPCKPNDYYIYDFYLKKNKKHGRNYIFKYQTKNMLYRMLLSKKDRKKLSKIAPLTNKDDFEKRALEAGLPIIPTICIIDQGEVQYAKGQNIENVKGSLFAKSLSGRGGKDAEVWNYNKEQNRYERKKDHKIYDFLEIIDLYKKTSDTKPIIIQKQMKNHQDLKELSCNALSTYRIVTMIDEKEEIEVVGASFRMAARKGKSVDNIHKGGIAAPIHIKTGILGEATDLGINVKTGYLTHHPITNAQIKGYTVPMWKEAKELAQRAHQAFKPRVIIGWDIAITEEGPILVEGNAQPCIDLIQRPSRTPLTTTRFGELIKYHIERNVG